MVFRKVDGSVLETPEEAAEIMTEYLESTLSKGLNIR